MKTNEIYTGKDILMFKISLNGWSDSRRMGGKGRITFEGFEKITDCYDFQQNTFIREDDDVQILTDCSDRELMDSSELQHAINTGIGRLDFDGDYNTVYTTYLEDLDEDEYNALDEDMQRVYLVVVCRFDEDKLNKIDDDYLRELFDGDEDLFEYLYQEAIEEEE